MGYFGGVKHGSACFKPKGRSLVLINDSDTPFFTVDHLKIDLVIVNVIGNFPTLGQPNVRSNDLTSKPVGYQVAILHPGPADYPVRTTCGSGWLKMRASEPQPNLLTFFARRGRLR